MISLEADVNESNAVGGHSMMRSMAPFEPSLQSSWRASRDATLLDGKSEATRTNLPRLDGMFRPGGLAAWQANRALKYIEVNLGSKMAIREIADYVALSKSHFSRAFKRSLGSAPMAYVASRRVERARLMLTSTQESLTDIALACGFSDQPHFNRLFRRAVGMSPGRWRRSSIDFQPTDKGDDFMEISRRTFTAALVAGAAASMTSIRGIGATATAAKARNVVFVHGLFADGSSWSEVIARLQAAGLNATSVQNPLTTLPEAVASAQRVLARQDGPTVLVGHSFSGMIVTEAGMHPNVSALVYVAARAPDADEDYAALAKKFPAPPASAGIIFDGDEGRLSEEAFLRDFAGDLPEAKAKVLYAVQEPFNKALLAGRTTQAAWRSKPSFYAVSTEDRTINPDLERFMAKRMGARTIEVKASHLSLISHPHEISELILEAARGTT
jgi:AraC-like DNA-binding protein/thioesterase domain-containing protein